ncbi:PQQ-binding-like beta-propeller repeat protein [Microbulbifer rhizosphaerae]|uniref:Pyrrolo-quinoline quinone repeat domain-containing protein n=1 Tax=Microbulbifer rhizosphaerae TaxID=1562603 RepID=A0A7W4WF16_9GAMM|nr:PQQ-binding-like beta-propeller repeat protein [Microbulbifer rhizosphaerae]MBB3062468.1 hypothetical protein [Microbulbifer rhizosphaerae]
MTGSAVKGPLKFASVSVFAVDYNSPLLKGSPVTSGKTDATGAFRDIEFESTGADYYLIEVDATAETVDISTGASPIISGLKTIASAQALEEERPVFATVSTTLALEMLRLNGGAGTDSGFKAALSESSDTIKQNWGFELIDGVDLFYSAPVVDDTTPLLDVLAYRTVLEAQSALIWRLSAETGVSVDRVIELVAADLLDGRYDGLTLLTAQDYQNGARQLFEHAALLQIDALDIPQTGSSRQGGTDYLVGETVQLLTAEAPQTGGSRDVQLLEDEPGYINLPAFPTLSDYDYDGDGAGDEADGYPKDGNCSFSTDGDGKSCYLTLLAGEDLEQAFADSDGNSYLVARGNEGISVYRWNRAGRRIDKKLITIKDGLPATQFLLHEQHNRLYLAYGDGSIHFIGSKSPNELHYLTTLDNPAEKLIDAGSYLLVQGDDSWSQQTISADGAITESDDYFARSDYYAWEAVTGRLYKFDGAPYPYDLEYSEIDQSNGTIGYARHFPYESDTRLQGPIVLLPQRKELLLGSGYVYSTDSLRLVDRSIAPFSQADFDGSTLITLAESAQGTTAKAYDSAGQIFHREEFPGTPEAILKSGPEYLIITRTAAGKYLFLDFGPSRDIDGDGIANLDDAFPYDAAASADTDGDGWPDAWNPGIDPNNIETDLELDVFPEDSACQRESEGENGQCSIDAQVHMASIDDQAQYGDIIYNLSIQDRAIYPWNATTGNFLNPILLKSTDHFGTPRSIAVDANGSILLGTEFGEVLRLGDDLPLTVERLLTTRLPVTHLVATGESVLTISEKHSTNYRLNYYNHEYQHSAAYYLQAKPNAVTYSPEQQRFYMVSSLYGLSSYGIDEESSRLTDHRSYYYPGASFSTFIGVSADGKQILTLGDTIVRSFLTEPYLDTLAPPKGYSSSETDFPSRNAFWFDDFALVAFDSESGLSLAGYTPDLKSALFILPLQRDDIERIAKVSDGLALALRSDTGDIEFIKVALLGDRDEDGLPLWWEVQYGLDDEYAGDAANDTDGDGLTALEEFQAGTSPETTDSDGDSLSDWDEIFTHGTDPASADTDGDLLPDDWELAAGTNPVDSSDMEGDVDGDGYSNYIEFLNGTDASDPTDIPTTVSSAYFSFEDSELPEQWQVSASEGAFAIGDTLASEGTHSLEISGEADISWNQYFAPVEIRFDYRSQCSSIYDKQLTVYLDDVKSLSVRPEQTYWQSHSLLLPAGQRDIRISVTSENDTCALHLDNFVVSPLQDTIEMGASFVTQSDAKLTFYNNHNEKIHEVSIPGNSSSSGYSESARDIAILDDERIAVFNGTFSPILSVYSPSEHTWQHLNAPGWSTVNNGTYGGIDSWRSKVFTTNMAVSGSPSQGLVVFDLSDNSVEFVSGGSYIDLTVGSDGILYALTGNSVEKYRADTLEPLEQISVDSARSVGVDTDGNLYLADWGGMLKKYDASGTLQQSLELGGNFYDISVRENGDIILTSWFDNIALTSTDLHRFVRLSDSASFVDYTPGIESDGDGLPDWWENYYGLDPTDPTDAEQDLDGDGLTALEEYALGTAESEPDSDSDGVTDGDEVLVHGTDPLQSDSDGDGLNDGDEVSIGSDPNNPDTDGDLLTDSEEVELGTDPLSADSDGDDMDDAYEIAYGLDALADDSGDDEDGDGLTNLEEFHFGSSPIDPDTDGDSLTDAEEYTLGTSPVQKDSDGDRVRDDWELAYGLDPLDAADGQEDGDLDQFSNLEEFLADTSPLDGSDFPQPVLWGSAQGDAGHTGYTPLILDASNFAFRWDAVLPDTFQLHPVVAGDGGVYVSNDSYFGTHRLYGLDASDGSILWEKDYSDIHSINPPAYANGQVYFQTGGHEDSFIRGVDATTGVLDFATAYGNQWSTFLAPTVFDGQLYMAGGYYGGIYSHDAVTGEENWFTSTAQYDGFTPAVDDQYVYAFIKDLAVYDRTSGELAYRIDIPSFDGHGYSAGMATVLTPLDNVVAIQAGTLVVFDLEKREILWEKKSGYSGQPSSHLGRIYVRQNNILKVLDEITGELLWTYEADEPLTSNIVITKTHLFVGGDTTTYAVDLESQETAWSYGAPGNLSLSDEGVLYISGTSLTAIDLIQH